MLADIHNTPQVSSPVEGLSNTPSLDSKEKELFAASKALYFSQIHFLIMQSFKALRRTLRENAEKKDEEHEYLEKRDDNVKSSDLIAERRHIEVFGETYAQKFQVWEESSHDHRHLHFPI